MDSNYSFRFRADFHPNLKHLRPQWSQKVEYGTQDAGIKSQNVGDRSQFIENWSQFMEAWSQYAGPREHRIRNSPRLDSSAFGLLEGSTHAAEEPFTHRNEFGAKSNFFLPRVDDRPISLPRTRIRQTVCETGFRKTEQQT
ncbi:MAG: hypothetical protein R3D80_13160 [Paracoccaceae bacterium]